MKLKDRIRTLFFLFKNKKNRIIAGRKNKIKKSDLKGKNIIGNENEIINSEVGFGSYIGDFNRFDGVNIGKYCSISSCIEVITGSHPVGRNISTHPAFYTADYKKFQRIKLSYISKTWYDDDKKVKENWNVVIGNDVWIGYGVKILQGVSIGDGSIIAAGALVTKDVEPYSIVGGVPAKFIRNRFLEDEVDMLKELCWWDKREEWIIQNAEKFKDISNFKKG